MINEFTCKPKTIDDIGKDVFISVPFYRRSKKHRVIYINPKIYKEIYKKDFVYDAAVKEIERDFSLTLDSSKGKEIVGNAYIDRQGDPTDIALNGNKGSGRAFYLYQNCNIKGDKTPFATSPRDDYSNGKYSLDCALQECLISNVLNSYDEFSNFETLAIIDLDEKYLFPHTTGELPCGLMVRYAKNRELYRFSHRFINNKEMSKEEILEISRKIGEMEGYKFIYRFLHGAWSIGNLSIDSNMIDLDTSFFTKGRHPQWSFTDRFKTNYFGFEYLGQIMVMETILNSDLNVDNVKVDEVKETIEKERINSIRKSFVSLMGYSEGIYDKYKKKIDYLADEFIYLSALIYDNYDNLNCIDSNCNNTYVFDFSRFFRHYEIAKQSKSFSIQKGMSLLVNSDGELLEYQYDNEEYHQKIKSFFVDIIIDSDDKYFKVFNRALTFIKEYDELAALIDENENIDKNSKLVRCYLENEDKNYLMARKWIRGELIDFLEDKGEKACHELINLIIDTYSKKDYSKEKLLCDMHLFIEGYLLREITTKGDNRFVFKSFEILDTRELTLDINGRCLSLKSEDGRVFTSMMYKNENIENIRSIEISDSKQNICFNRLDRDIEIVKKEIVSTKKKI